jgi:hypothetical protein
VCERRAEWLKANRTNVHDLTLKFAALTFAACLMMQSLVCGCTRRNEIYGSKCAQIWQAHQEAGRSSCRVILEGGFRPRPMSTLSPGANESPVAGHLKGRSKQCRRSLTLGVAGVVNASAPNCQ